MPRYFSSVGSYLHVTLVPSDLLFLQAHFPRSSKVFWNVIRTWLLQESLLSDLPRGGGWIFLVHVVPIWCHFLILCPSSQDADCQPVVPLFCCFWDLALCLPLIPLVANMMDIWCLSSWMLVLLLGISRLALSSPTVVFSFSTLQPLSPKLITFSTLWTLESNHFVFVF